MCGGKATLSVGFTPIGMANLPKTPEGRRYATVAIALSLAIVTVAERDLHRRAASEVRGEKWIWRVVCLNALGALAYFLWGRQPTA